MIYNTDSEKSLKEIPEVDVKLLKLAQIIKGKVVTNDFNLNKVAAIQDVPVLNVKRAGQRHETYGDYGENMTVTLIKQGKDQNQAVAYLDDGTMIVVENGPPQDRADSGDRGDKRTADRSRQDDLREKYKTDPAETDLCMDKNK